jgi:hypothetical protein
MKHINAFLFGVALGSVLMEAAEEERRTSTRFHGNPWNGKTQKYAVHCRSMFGTRTIVTCETHRG